MRMVLGSSRWFQPAIGCCVLATFALCGALSAEQPQSPPSNLRAPAGEGTGVTTGEETLQVSPAESAHSAAGGNGFVATSSGPDLIVGHVFACEQLGRVGTFGSGTIGMSCWTTACNSGDQSINWIELPDIDHPVISVNLFRLRTVDGTDRLVQLGQSWVKHGFGTENHDDCGFGCTGGDFSHDGPGCSDTYAASQFVACDMGPRSMINPYTGEMPAGGNLGSFGGCSNMYPSRDHRDHVHTPISHRLQVQDVDLIPSLNVGARYFSEGQYITPHEFTAANGNQNNDVSYSRVRVDGGDACGGDFAFSDLSYAYPEEPAIHAWPGASRSLVEPAPLTDGRGILAYKVTNLGNVWRYEYALYNQNMDRSMGSLSIPLPADVAVTHAGFHAPLNHSPEPHADNYSNAPWTFSTSGGAASWSTSPFGVDPLANAVRWGTMYNFWFEASSPPQPANVTIGLFKTGGTIAVVAVGPSAAKDCNGNSIADRCDLDCGAPGCSVPGCGTRSDCNANGVPDDCEPDCNNNGIADRCDIASAFSQDCDADAVPDECEPFTDCNGNAIRDDCEVYADSSLDGNGNGVPDECESISGATYYVDDNAPGDPAPGSTAGSDPNEDGSPAHPFDAIQEAINASTTGDTVMILDGVYAGPGNSFLVLRGKAIHVRSKNGPENCVIDLQNANWFASIEVSGPALRFEGLHFSNSANQLPGVPALYCSGSSPTIAGCKFTGAGPLSTGLELYDNSKPLITHCTFIGLRTAIACYTSLPVVSNCLIRGGTNGILALQGNGSTDCFGASSPRIENCTISGAGTGVRAIQGAKPIVANSIVYGNSTGQITFDGFSGAVVSFSDVQGGFPGTGNINMDPLFVNAAGGDYRLSAGSPCIDAGDNSASTIIPQTDVDGGPRLFDDPGTFDTGSGAPPIIDIGADEWVDCNGNLIDDSRDIDLLTSTDCNGNRVPDECEVFQDCNGNTIRDTCDISAGTSQDCNGNWVPDTCDVGTTSADCNANTIPDECEADCNRNHIPDSCDISASTSADVNGNNIPDECEPSPPGDLVWSSDMQNPDRTSRSLRFRVTTPAIASAAPGQSAIKVTMMDLQHPDPRNLPQYASPNFSTFDVGIHGTCAGATTSPNFNGHHCSSDAECLGNNGAITTDDGTCSLPGPACTAAGEANGCARWVGRPWTFYESQGPPQAGPYRAARLQCTPLYWDWITETATGPITVVGAEIIPSSEYIVQTYAAPCQGAEAGCTNVSAPMTMFTRRKGDLDEVYQMPSPTGLSQPNAIDVSQSVAAVKHLLGAPSHARGQMQPNLPELNTDVNVLDVVEVVDALKGIAYSFPGPCPCPSTVTCGGSCTGCAGLCVKTCIGGDNDGEPCVNNTHCPGPGGACSTVGTCRDKCGRCTP